MPADRTIIDFETIWKKINDSLSEQEEALLSEWLSEDPLHQQYFDNAMRYYMHGTSFGNNATETRKAWKLLKKNGLKRTKTQLRWAFGLSAAVITILLIFTYLLPTTSTKTTTVAVSTLKIIKPGCNQAKLILDDGSVYDLTSSKHLVLKEGGSEIKSEGAKLEYTEKTAISEVRYNTLSIPRGGEFFLQLSDGTKVWLNSETELRYPVQFAGEVRKVELTGEAFFEVAPNEKIPFLVESGEQMIRVTGTQFNISSYKEDPLIYTTLVKGSVEVYFKDKPEIRETLAPNQQSTINKTAFSIAKREVDPYQYMAWKEGRFVFVDERLDEIMKTLSKWYNVDVVFSKNELKDIRFTGNLERYADFNKVLSKIGKTNEVNFTIENKQIILK